MKNKTEKQEKFLVTVSVSNLSKMQARLQAKNRTTLLKKNK